MATNKQPVASRTDVDVLTTIRDGLSNMEDAVLEIRDLARVVEMMSESGNLSDGISAAFDRVATCLIDKAERLDEDRGDLWRMVSALLK